MSDGAARWPALSALQRRVLGVLIEKQKTSPDVYPMSVNALVAAANQKSNRDPVMTVDDAAIEETLQELLPLDLVVRVDTGRVEKWRHRGYERWPVDKNSIAVLAELFLRGPQTEGALRAHVSRMEPIPDLPALHAVVAPMVESGLAVWLSPEGRRGALLTHGFHAAEELERLRSGAAAPPVEAPVAASGHLDDLRSELAELRRQVEELQAVVARLAAERPASGPAQ